MKYNLVTYQAIMFLFVFFGVFSVHADDKPRRIKKGGMPYKDLWKEEDVKKYLNLPYVASTDDVVGVSMKDIVSKLEGVKKVGKYQIVKNKNRLFKQSKKKLNAISFELKGEGLPVLQVTVYDYKSWNSVCDKLFKHITNTVALWNKIPDYYVMKKTEDIYTLAHNSKNFQKWHFELKKRFVIGIDSDVNQKTDSKEKTITQINQVIRRLVAIIEGKNDDVKP